MSYRTKAVAAALLLLATLAPVSFASAADMPMKVKAVKAPPDLPFFLLIDDRVSFSYIPTATDPGVFSRRPDGSINGKTAKQVYSFTHFDIWAYGTNFFNISMYKSDHNDPANGCTLVNTGCGGATEIYGLIRSTIGFNEVFNTKAFSIGPLRDVSFEIGADANTENNALAPAKRDIVAGLQFLGFLPESLQLFAISGRAAWYGPKGPENSPLAFAVPGNIQTKTEFNSEPIRLTFDASKAVWGPKYTHFVDLWVAYRYWQNKFGLDHANSVNCNVSPGVSNNSCTESSVYSGITVKF